MKTLVLTLTLGIAMPAAADDSPPFLGLDRSSDQTMASFEFASVFIDGVDAAMRLSPRFQYLHNKRVGAYAEWPMYIGIGAPTPLGEATEFSPGNLSFGGIYAADLSLGTLALRAGLMVPTASDDFAQTFARLPASFGKLQDVASAYPDVTALRIGGNYMVRGRKFFFQGEAGADILLTDPNGIDLGHFFHLGLGGGMAINRRVAMSLEFGMSYSTAAEETEQYFGLGIQFTNRLFTPYIGIVVPVDADAVDAILVAGFESHL